jgi:hypothetical protein
VADPFEIELEAMFDAPPAFADEAAFAASVDRRLRRRMIVRHAALAVAGVAGGAVALSRLPDLLLLASAEAARWLGEAGGLLAQPYAGVSVWMVAGLAAAAVVLVRNVEV